MKTYFYIGAAVAAVLGASTVNAQVLGGNVVGGLGGTLSGGTRDIGVMTQGRGSGAFGADLDTGSLRRSTSEVGGRVRHSTDRVRGRAESTIGATKDKGQDLASSAAVSANGAARGAFDTASSFEAPRLDATTDAAGSLASQGNIAGNEAAGTLSAAHQQQLLAAAPELPEAPAMNPTDKVVDAGKATDVPASTPEQNVKPRNFVNGSLAGGLDQSSNLSSESSQIPVTAEGSGSAKGNATASKRGVSANTSAEANGSASASMKR